MNRKQIVKLLEAKDEELKNAISVMDLDSSDETFDYSAAQVTDIEMILKWLVTEKMPIKESKERYISYKEGKDPLSALSPDERAKIEKVLDEIAGESGAVFAKVLETRRNEVLGALIQRFDRGMIRNIVGVVQSPEFKQNFGQFLLTGDRTALPGKSAASLPSSKAGATNS